MRVLIYRDNLELIKKAFIAHGHIAQSCDEDIFSMIRKNQWDLFIAFPPCTYLTISGNRWMKPEYKDRFPKRVQQRENAIRFFKRLASALVKRICIENPVGVMSTAWRKPNQYVHPYYFGDPHSKKMGLWLKNLPLLIPTDMVEPEFYIFKDGRRDPLWHFNTLSLPTKERREARRPAFQGLAKAMAKQWGGLK